MRKELKELNSPVAWISHEYMASSNRGDQSSSPALNASCPEEIRLPRALDHLERTERRGQSALCSTVRDEGRRTGRYFELLIDLDFLEEISHPYDWLSTEGTLVHCQLEGSLKILV